MPGATAARGVRDEEISSPVFDPSNSPLPIPERAPGDPEDQPRVLELLAVVLTWMSMVLIGVALVGAAATSLLEAALALVLVGILAGLGAFGSSLGLGTLRHLRANRTGGNAYDRMRGARKLHGASLFVQSLSVVAWAIILLRALSRAGIGSDLEVAVVERGVLVLVAALGAAIGYAHLQSLRTPTVRDRSVPSWTLIGLAGVASFLFAIFAILVLIGAHPGIGPVDWEGDDVPFLALAATALLAIALRRSRGLPATTKLLASAKGPESGLLAGDRQKAVIVPAILAFALLLVVFLLVFLFGIGIGDLLNTVGNNPLLLGAFLFLVLALLGSLGLAMLLSRSAERDAPLFTELTDKKQKERRWIIGASSAAATVLGILAFLSWVGILNEALALHLVCLTLLVALGPYGFYSAREATRIRRLEERFPDFLRDIASSHKGGLTLNASVTIAARGEYGPLTPEVRKMADQLSWNVSFHEALERFSERVETPLVQRAVNLILQADKSGGSTTDVLLAAARDAREIKNLENERRQTMGLYTLVVYITFFVFLGVAATLYGQFAPAIVESSRAVQDSAIAGTGDFAQSTLSLEQYQRFYFVGAIVQAVGDGIVAGLLGSGKARLGLRHGFLMVLATYATFLLLL